jgi:hypothetical protein
MDESEREEERSKYMYEEYMDDECMPMYEGHMKHMLHMMHGKHMLPGMNHMMLAVMSLPYFRIHADPIIEYACRRLQKENFKCAIMEATLLGLLIGMGNSHEKAHMILEHWKRC